MGAIKTVKEMTDIMSAVKFDKYGHAINLECSYRYDAEWTDATYPAWDWSMFDYRIKQEPKYEPYSFKDVLLGMKVRHNFTAVRCVIVGQSEKKVILGGGISISYEELCSDYSRIKDNGISNRPMGRKAS